MKFSTKNICINYKFPILQAGYIQQVEPVNTYHDDLYARVMAFEDESKVIYLISVDNLGLPLTVQNCIEKTLQENTSKKVNVVISCTHTHFAPNPSNEEYQKFFIEQVAAACLDLEFKEYSDLNIAYNYAFFDETGKSRISNHETKNIYVQCLQILSNTTRLATLITYNCHPTTHDGYTPYFTSEYPGFVLNYLSQKYPNEQFSFMQGASGDISTRFTRDSQDYNTVITLGTKLANKVEDLLNSPVKVSPLTLSYESQVLPLEHSFDPIDLSKTPDNITDREIETINIGVKVREKLATELDTLQKEALISKVSLGDFNIIFAPNELFSSYIDCINVEHSILVCYSNGRSPYVTGLDVDFITYECFTDTLTKTSKQNLMNTLYNFSK